MKSLMKEPSSRKKPNTGSNRRLEDNIPKMGRKIVLEKDVSDIEDDNSDTPEEIIEKPKIQKKVVKKNKNILEREDEAEDPVSRHKQLLYIGIPDLNSHVKDVVEEYDQVPLYEKWPMTYKHLAPIENVKNEEQALDSLLKAPVTISAEILMSIFPGIRQELFQALAKKKVPVQTAPNCKVTVVEEVDEEAPPIKIKKSELKSEKIALEDLNI